MTINEALENFKSLINDSIIEGGGNAKNAMIRSSRPILNIHEAVKLQLINNGVNPDLIFPPLGNRTPELKLAGSLKQKDQDICIIPDLDKTEEILSEGLLDGTVDIYGFNFTNKTISINVRSQVSSVAKNFDTLYERTISEAINLHDRCPEMILGEVYLLAVPEYEDKSMKNNQITFKNTSQSTVEKYIKSFQAINNRTDTSKFYFKYERACLLIVDFSQNPVKLYNSDEELKADGLLPEDSTLSIEGLTWDSFSSDLLSIYDQRFTTDI